MVVPSWSVRSHNSAQVVGVFRQGFALRHNEMKQESAKHSECGGGKRQRKRVVREHFKREGGESFGCVCHASKMGCASSFVKHGANVEAFVVVFVGYF